MHGSAHAFDSFDWVSEGDDASDEWVAIDALAEGWAARTPEAIRDDTLAMLRAAA